MSSFAISLISLLCLAGGLLLGLWLQRLLPADHLSKESQDTIKLGSGMVATMSALVLGLLVSSGKSSFDDVNAAVAQNGARVIQLDHVLAQYGPETRAARDQLRNSVAERVQQIWGKTKSGDSGIHAVEKSRTVPEMQAALGALTPTTEQQKSALNQATQIIAEIWQNRLLIMEEQQTPVPPVFLALLVFWLALLFMSFGLFAPRNTTVFAVLLVCAFSASSAIFLILEMSHPLDGSIKVSSAPLVKALELIGH